MKKTLLIYDDFSALTLLESVLKRIGFDVVAINAESKLSDAILSFHPEIVVARGNSKMVSGVQVGKRLAEQLKFHGKFLLVLPEGVRPGASELAAIKMDALMAEPFEPDKLVAAIAKMAGLDSAALLTKYHKSKMSVDDPALKNGLHVRGTLDAVESRDVGGQIPLEDPIRVKKYDKFLKLPLDIRLSSHVKAEVKKRQKELKKRWDFSMLEKLDILKRQFTRALFRKTR
jgi:CheY-like chemotaxis protein